MRNTETATVTYGEIKRILWLGVALGFGLGFGVAMWIFG
jgi:hypothetical protein